MIFENNFSHKCSKTEKKITAKKNENKIKFQPLLPFGSCTNPTLFVRPDQHGSTRRN